MALYSKLPLNNQQILFLRHAKVPSFKTNVSLPDSSTFQLITVHPVAPFPSSKYPTSIGGKEVALLEVGRMVARNVLPTVVVGDFNDVGWSHNTTQFAAINNPKRVVLPRSTGRRCRAPAARLREGYRRTSEWNSIDRFSLEPRIQRYAVAVLLRRPKSGWQRYFPLQSHGRPRICART